MWGRLREEFRTTGNGVLQKRKYVYKLSNQKELEVYRALADAPCICELHGFGFKEDVILKLRKYDRAVIDELQTDEMMSAARYLKLWHALSTALRHMHALGVAHRDVKPDNILVTGDTFVLCDFHISQQTDVPAVPCGTEAYAAPELFVFGASNDPVPTDIWSAGVTLLACACGRLLWLRASKTDKRFECFTKRSTDDYVNEMLNTFQSAHFNATTRHLRCMIVHSLHLRPDCRPTSAAMAMVCS